MSISDEEAVEKCVQESETLSEFVSCVVEFSDDRMDWISTRKNVKDFMAGSPPYKPWQTAPLAGRLGIDPHTAQRHLDSLENQGLDGGTLEKAHTNGRSVYYNNPKACATLRMVKEKAKEEDKDKLAEEACSLHTNFCKGSKDES